MGLVRAKRAGAKSGPRRLASFPWGSVPGHAPPPSNVLSNPTHCPVESGPIAPAKRSANGRNGPPSKWLLGMVSARVFPRVAVARRNLWILVRGSVDPRIDGPGAEDRRGGSCVCVWGGSVLPQVSHETAGPEDRREDRRRPARESTGGSTAPARRIDGRIGGRPGEDRR